MRTALLVLLLGVAAVVAAEEAIPAAGDTGAGTKPGTTECVDANKVYNEIFKKCLPKAGTDGFIGHDAAALTGRQRFGGHPLGPQPLMGQQNIAGQKFAGGPIAGQHFAGSPVAGGAPLAGGEQLPAGGEDVRLSESGGRRAPVIVMPGAVRAYIPMAIYGKGAPKEITQHLEKEPQKLTGEGAGEQDRTGRAEAFRGGRFGFGRRFGGPVGWGRRFGGPVGWGRFSGPFGYGWGSPFASPFPFAYDPYAFAPPTVVTVPTDMSGFQYPPAPQPQAPGKPANATEGEQPTGQLRGGLSGDRRTGPVLIMPGAVRLDMPIVVYGADLETEAGKETGAKGEEFRGEEIPGGDAEAAKEPAKESLKEPEKESLKEPGKEQARGFQTRGFTEPTKEESLKEPGKEQARGFQTRGLTEPTKEESLKEPAGESKPTATKEDERRAGLGARNVWRNPLFSEKLKSDF